MPDDDSQPGVLFVCMGNICRSPAAEGVFRHLVHERGLNGSVRIDSAGTIGHHAGQPADARMRRAADRRGYDLASRARKVDADDLRGFSLVVAMDRANVDDLEALHGGASDRVRLLGEFLPDEMQNHGGPPDVPDPYYGGDYGFEQVLDMVEAACPAILDAVLNGQSEP